MFPPHLDYLKNKEIIWHNPCRGYFDFWDNLKKIQEKEKLPFEKIWKKRSMKKNKEKYASAIAALCFQEEFGSQWWFTKTDQDPPDGIIATVSRDPENGSNLINVREVEIVEHFKGSIIETIQTKLKNKNYQPETILICLLSNENMDIINLKTISNKINKKSLPLKNIFLLFNGFLIKASDKNLSGEEKLKKILEISLAQISPTYNFITINPLICCKNFLEGKNKAFLKFEKRGLTPGFKPIKENNPPRIYD